MGSTRRGLMAVQTIRQVVCDRCGSAEGDTRKWGVVFPETGRRTFDLCEDCSIPLREFEKLRALTGDLGPKRHVQPILSEQEVEKRMRAARKGAKTSRRGA